MLGNSLLLIFLILRVLDAVMPEIEGLGRLDDLAEPFRELSVVDSRLATPRLVRFHLDKHLEDVEVETLGPANEACEVLGCDESIVVCVDIEEGLPHTDPVGR